MPSTIWSMRCVPRVVTLRTCVSPLWKSPEPWVMAMTPTSAERGRMSVVSLPSMRRPSARIRSRTMVLESERTADLACCSTPSTSGRRSATAAMICSAASRSAARRSALSAISRAADSGPRPNSATASAMAASQSASNSWSMVGFTPAVAMSRRWSATASVTHCLDSSSPSARTASSTFGAPVS